jgi:hypothetical protein
MDVTPYQSTQEYICLLTSKAVSVQWVFLLESSAADQVTQETVHLKNSLRSGPSLRTRVLPRFRLILGVSPRLLKVLVAALDLLGAEKWLQALTVLALTFHCTWVLLTSHSQGPGPIMDDY